MGVAQERIDRSSAVDVVLRMIGRTRVGEGRIVNGRIRDERAESQKGERLTRGDSGWKW